LIQGGSPRSLRGRANDISESGHNENFLILKTAKGRLYINPGDVMMIQTEDADDKIMQRKPVPPARPRRPIVGNHAELKRCMATPQR
jgi:hypothetical protein